MTKIIALHDLIYIAGFLDGDGSIIAQVVTCDDCRWGFKFRITIQFTQHSHRKIYLEKLKDILDAGTIRTRTGTLVSDYVIADLINVYGLLKQLQPYLRVKQKQADLAITLIEQLPLAKDSKSKFIELAYLTDKIAALNDSKNIKITGAFVEENIRNLKK